MSRIRPDSPVQKTYLGRNFTRELLQLFTGEHFGIFTGLNWRHGNRH